MFTAIPYSQFAMARAGPGSLSPGVCTPIQLPTLADHLQFYADIPSIVHSLIRDMKALETALHRWGRTEAAPENVSDCYVQFGVQFQAVIHAFEGYDIPTGYARPLSACISGGD